MLTERPGRPAERSVSPLRSDTLSHHPKRKKTTKQPSPGSPLPLADDSQAVVTLGSAALELVTRGCGVQQRRGARQPGLRGKKGNQPGIGRRRESALVNPPSATTILVLQLRPQGVLLRQKLKGHSVQVGDSTPWQAAYCRVASSPPLLLVPLKHAGPLLPNFFSNQAAYAVPALGPHNQLSWGKGAAPFCWEPTRLAA